ncbi:HrpE/YscL family type III secretion apparatus protein [Burkholderia sp. ABCPW 14]|uniref:HrpE/YscL family type III secretion apparatus protein n=1 Tax=Burkholderia sp. ABCPW 14 TaxID=1637860 RepID=UPI0012E37365|nr:HrpE/YscL family type III secretion apparatus protein [Burkholderia sp. ABCPW 14]
MPSLTIRQCPDSIAPTGGVLIKRKPLSQAVHAENLTREAKRRAQQLVREAGDEAQACWQHAARDGYEAGFRFVVEQLADYLMQCRRLKVTLLERVTQEVQESLRQFLSDPELMQRFADDFAARNGGCGDQPVRVSIPDSAKRIAPAIRERFAQTYPGVEVTCSNVPAFIVEWGEEIAEFNPCDVARELSGAALAACLDVSQAIDADALARNVMTDALRRLEAPNDRGEQDAATHEEIVDDQVS